MSSHMGRIKCAASGRQEGARVALADSEVGTNICTQYYFCGSTASIYLLLGICMSACHPIGFMMVVDMGMI